MSVTPSRLIWLLRSVCRYGTLTGIASNDVTLIALRGGGGSVMNPRSRDTSLAARTTVSASGLPMSSVGSRSVGPAALSAATTFPSASRTGAATQRTPTSRSWRSVA